MNGIRTIRTSFIADVKIDHGDNRSIYSLKCGTSTLKLKARQGLCLILRQHTDIIKIICSNSTITFDLLLWHCSTTKSHLSNKHQYLEYSSPFSSMSKKARKRAVCSHSSQHVHSTDSTEVMTSNSVLGSMSGTTSDSSSVSTDSTDITTSKNVLGSAISAIFIKVAMPATKTSRHTQILS